MSLLLFYRILGNPLQRIDGKKKDGKKRKPKIDTRELLLKNLADLPQAIAKRAPEVPAVAFDDEEMLLTLML